MKCTAKTDIIASLLYDRLANHLALIVAMCILFCYKKAIKRDYSPGDIGGKFRRTYTRTRGKQMTDGMGIPMLTGPLMHILMVSTFHLFVIQLKYGITYH